MLDYSLYLVTDDPSRYVDNWLDNVVAAVEGGVTLVQYRDTESDNSTKYQRIRDLQDALKRFHTPLVVNNDAYLAKSVQAEGVHVGQSDMPVEAVREIVGPNCEIGLSITAWGQTPKSADGLGIGPVFDARKTKVDASEALGIEGLKKVLTYLYHDLNCQLPAVAIGGITYENAPAILATGVKGLAVVSAFSKSTDSYASAKNFSLLLNHRRQ